MRALLLFALLGFASPALAQTSDATATAAESIAEESRLSAEPPRTIPEAWDYGRERFFISAAIDLGFLYLRPRFALGWGKPHSEWVGVEANPIVSGNGFGGYAGIRATLAEIGVRAGARYFYGFNRSLLTPEDTYDRQGIELRTGHGAQYVTLEAELTTTLPIGPIVFLSELAGAAVVGTGDSYVFEETLRVVVAPPFVARGRIGFVVPFGPENALSVGPVAEGLYVPGRDAVVLRAGLVARVRLFNDLEVRATFVPVLVSPDNLGMAGADFGLLGVRYLWATGE